MIFQVRVFTQSTIMGRFEILLATTVLLSMVVGGLGMGAMGSYYTCLSGCENSADCPPYQPTTCTGALACRKTYWEGKKNDFHLPGNEFYFFSLLKTNQAEGVAMDGAASCIVTFIKLIYQGWSSIPLLSCV